MTTTRPCRRRAWMVALVMSGTVIGPAARAQGTGHDLTAQEAEARFKEGLRRHDRNDEEGARLSFLEAYAVLKRPNILFDLARAEQLTGHAVEALGHYKLFVKEPGVSAADIAVAQRHINELNGVTGHLQIDVSAGAEVSVDASTLAQKGPLQDVVDVSAGGHTCTARLGEQTKTLTVTARPGETVRVTIDVSPPAPPPVPVEPIESATLPPPEPPRSHFAKHFTVIGLDVAGLVALGLGVGYSLAAKSKSNDITSLQQGNSDSSCFGATNSSRCNQLSSDASAHRTDVGLTAGFISAGVALFLAGAGVLVFWPSTANRSSSTGATILPTVTPSGGSMNIVGRF
jgi:hypothetical protein